MTKRNKFEILSGIIFFAFLIFTPAKHLKASGPTEIQGDIIVPTIWTADKSPYIVRKIINVNAPLRIEAGVIVKFDDVLTNYSRPIMMVRSDLVAVGTASAKIIFTSLKDDLVGGDTNGDANQTIPRSGDWNGISRNDSVGSIKLEHVIISYANKAVNYQSVYTSYYTGLSIKYSELKNNDTGIFLRGVESDLSNVSIHNNGDGIEVYCSTNGKRIPVIKNSAIYNNGNGVRASCYYYQLVSLDARNNWWGDASGPYSYYFNPSGKGNRVIGNWSMFIPWLTEKPSLENPGCQENCFSNVFFLPGIKASRLYKDGFLGEDKLWIPNYFGSDVEALALDENGESVEDVYTRDVVDEVGIPVIGGNLYKSFIEDLDSLKSDGKINDYNLFAYDWRQNVEEIAKEGTPYPAGDLKSAVAELEKLANASKSGKATIIAHSNGGLVAKALMMEMERLGKADKVDKIVLVGTPQMGTPLSILSLLYGYDEASPLSVLISRSDARELAENMPGVYGLLPSAKYFERMENPFINFSANQEAQYKKFKDVYGENIDSFSEFKKFLLGTDDGRTEPEKNDVEMENILKSNLLDEASATHERLDDWTPPANVEVIQIAGWGLDTVSGVEYTEKEDVNCVSAPGNGIPVCVGMGTYKPIYSPNFTVDGDRVVVTPSALMMAEGENVKRYWVDLDKYNKDPIINKNQSHKDIFEMDFVRDFIDKIINKTDLPNSLPSYIFASRPSDYENVNSRLRMSLYSPLDVHLYDNAGRHTGPEKIVDGNGNEATVFEEAIPNSYYYQFGDRKYVGFEGGESIQVEMDGYALGAYTLKLEEIKETETGEEVVEHTTFENLPTVGGAKVTFNIPEAGIDEPLRLQADLDNDGADDYEVISVPNGTVTLDATPPEIVINSPENGEHLNNQFLTFAYLVTDNISAPQNTKVEALYDGSVVESGEEIDLSLQNLGVHHFSVSATDEAGNWAEKEITFQIVTNIEMTSQNVNHYFDLKLVVDEKTRDFLQVKIDELIHAQEMIVKLGGKDNENPKANQIKLFNKKIDDLNDFIRGKLSNLIFAPAKEILLQSLNFVKI